MGYVAGLFQKGANVKTETKEKIRIDKYLWSIRIFKTRSEAAAACESGKVRLGGSPVKAARAVGVGDEYEIRTEARKWVIKVTALLSARVAYPEAIKHYLDMTPEEAPDLNKFQAATFHTGKRRSKIGRPTKKQRRDIEDFTGDDTAEPDTEA
ncbi:MAG: RNA-binding S4 domain-containing protein [Chitinophagaceae bacterium]|nr:MAG: RNA-binding S4 domain-containing protein [Chitinophagaceae bacterium]